SVRSKKVLVKA
ncbi:secD/SecF GG Motif family protein, partial [Vibrio parahaemolyticus V-223/04]